MEFDRQVMGKNRECVRFCFIVFCFITVPEVAEIGLRRIRGGPQLPNASRHAPRRLSRLLRSGISPRGGTAPRDGVREHVRGALPGRRTPHAEGGAGTSRTGPVRTPRANFERQSPRLRALRVDRPEDAPPPHQPRSTQWNGGVHRRPLLRKGLKTVMELGKVETFRFQ